ncbi:MAG TPA: glycine oxidase ThiO [Candidatus Eisenbacteria bacterium]|nr:glycine oxidase ThiO [Candidatus Eisenbacteria bacterium]
MTVPRTPDVLVVGGGVIGCAIARELAGAGRSVVVVDRGPIGGQASSAAAGALGVASGSDEGERLELRRASFGAFPDLVASLHEETGLDVGFETRGVLAFAFDERDTARLADRVTRRRTQGLRAQWLDAAEVRALEPRANDAAVGAALFPDDAQLEAAAFTQALAASARRRGASIVPGVPVLAYERGGDRIERVRVGGEWIHPREVIVAAGPWTPAASGVDPGVAVVPVRGQMLALRPERPVCGHVLTAGDAFLIPRRDGEVWVGATFEDAGFMCAVTGDGVRQLLGHLARLTPEALRAPIVRAWAGLRPSVPGGGPVIGRARDAGNVLVATGHHRNGILLAPVTARTVAALVDGTPPPQAARPFVPAGRA